MWIFIIVYLVTIQTLQCSDISPTNQYDSESSEKHDWNKYEETDRSNEEKHDNSSEEKLDKSSEEKLDKSSEDTSIKSSEETTTLPTTIEETSIYSKSNANRRYWLVSSKLDMEPNNQELELDNNEKDSNIKNKISTLVEQTLHDTERKLRSLHRLKEKHKNEAPYKVGFILSLVKKSKDILNELFNVAVKNRDDYKALEELKIFEFIVHTNVDTTNLVRQMVEIHIQYINSSTPFQHRNRVVLL